jgi:hypothetical protein
MVVAMETTVFPLGLSGWCVGTSLPKFVVNASAEGCCQFVNPATHVNNIYKTSSYLIVNTLRLHWKYQPINALLASGTLRLKKEIEDDGQRPK